MAKKPAAKETVTLKHLFQGEAEIAKDQILWRGLKSAEERSHFIEALFSAQALVSASQALLQYLKGAPGGMGPAHAYDAQNHLNRCLSALDFILGARQARLSTKRNIQKKKKAKS